MPEVVAPMHVIGGHGLGRWRACVNTTLADWFGLPSNDRDLALWLASLLDAADETGVVHMNGRRWRVQRRLLSVLGAWVWLRLRRTRGHRVWRASRLLRQTGATVAMPLALVRRGRTEFLVRPMPPGPTVAGFLRGDREGLDYPPDRRTLAAAVGRQLGRISMAGLVQRDYALARLVVDPACAAGGEPVIIDPADMRHRLDDRQIEALLHRLAAEALACGATWRELAAALRALLKTDATLWAGHRRRLPAAWSTLSSRLADAGRA